MGHWDNVFLWIVEWLELTAASSFPAHMYNTVCAILPKWLISYHWLYDMHCIFVRMRIAHTHYIHTHTPYAHTYTAHTYAACTHIHSMHACTRTHIKAKSSAAPYVVTFPSEALGHLCITQALGVCTGKFTGNRRKLSMSQKRRCGHLKSNLVLHPHGDTHTQYNRH